MEKSITKKNNFVPLKDKPDMIQLMREITEISTKLSRLKLTKFLAKN